MLDKKIKIPVGADFEPIPSDRYTTQILDVNLVEQFNPFRGENQTVLNYKFVVLTEKDMPEKIGGSPETTRGRYLWRRCSQSLSEKSWLLKLAKGVKGRDLSKEELESFDPESLVGAQVDVMVDQTPSKDKMKIYNNILSFQKTAKKLPEYKEKVVEKSSRPAFEAPALGDPEATDFAGKSEEEIKNMTLDEVLG